MGGGQSVELMGGGSVSTVMGGQSVELWGGSV